MIASKSAETIASLTETRDELQRAACMCGDRETRDFIASCADRVDRMVAEHSRAQQRRLAAMLAAGRR